jgi:hypothetical protein
MNDNKNLLSAGLHIVNRHKRYIFWFWLLNLALALYGSVAFRDAVGPTLERSLFSDRLVHGFDIPVLLEMLSRPETGPTGGLSRTAAHFAFVFFFATFLFMPGVLEGYTFEGRLSREDFFRTCGRNLWRFIRLFLFFAIIAVPVGGLLFAGEEALVKKAGDSTYELLPFYTEVVALTLIFLILTAIRIWFDLAQIDIVVRDQRAVRRSVAAGFRYTRRNLSRLLGSYVAIALVGAVVLVLGVWVWHVLVPPSSVFVAFLVGQVMLILWLWARFWQRGSAAAFYMRDMAIAPPAYVPAAVIAPPALVPPLAPPAPEGGTAI